jgi:uncharacterized protein
MSKTKFEVYKDKKGGMRWRLLAQNGEPVAAGGEAYSDKRSVMNAVKKLKDWANTTNIVDLSAPKPVAKKDTKKPAKKANTKNAASKSATKKSASKSVAKKPAKKVANNVAVEIAPSTVL